MIHRTDCYLLKKTGSPSRWYTVCEAEDGDGWMVCYHTENTRGELGAHHRVKSLGHFETNEEACEALEEYAIKMEILRYVEAENPLQSEFDGEWIPMREETP